MSLATVNVLEIFVPLPSNTIRILERPCTEENTTKKEAEDHVLTKTRLLFQCNCEDSGVNNMKHLVDLSHTLNV